MAANQASLNHRNNTKWYDPEEPIHTWILSNYNITNIPFF
jgi:hypothetical protein